MAAGERFVNRRLTFTGGHVALQLVVPVGFGGQRRLHVLLVQAVQAAFGLQREKSNQSPDTLNTPRARVASRPLKYRTVPYVTMKWCVLF